jgi:hypothetical protein
MKILVLDNYDSFTYNLVHILRELGHAPEVHRNDKITLEDVGNYDKIMLSPGPGIPDEAGIMKDVIRTYGNSSIFQKSSMVLRRRWRYSIAPSTCSMVLSTTSKQPTIIHGR